MRANSSSARFPVLSLAAGAFSVMAEPQGGGTLSSDALGCRNHARACSFRERVPLSCDHGLIVGALPAVRFGPEEREDNRRSRRRFGRGDIHEMYPETAVAGCRVMDRSPPVEAPVDDSGGAYLNAQDPTLRQ